MCGRYTLSKPKRLAEHFGLDDVPDLLPRYNVSPTQGVPVVRLDPDGRRFLSEMRWGITPRWSPGKSLINAKCETVATLRTFAPSFRSRRCLLPADGFYEWKATPGQKRKQPYHFRLKSGDLFAFAGIWEAFKDGGGVTESCALLTTVPNGVVAAAHDRMPVILHPDAYDRWLVPGQPVDDLYEPYPGELMTGYPVQPPKEGDPRSVQPLPG